MSKGWNVWSIWGGSCDSGDIVGIGGFNVDRGAELTMVNADIDIHKGDVGGGSVPGEVDRIASVELFQESSEGVRPMGPE